MIRKFETSDFAKLILQKEQEGEADVDLSKHSAFSFFVHEKLVAVCWYIKIYEGRYEVFAYISADIGRNMLLFVRELKHFIEQKAIEFQAVRIELTVREGFVPGDRLAVLLGFEYEGTMKKIYKGLNYKLYARLF